MYKLVNGVRKRPSEAQKHGLTTLKKAVKQLGNRAIDKRTHHRQRTGEVAQRSDQRLGRFG
jgi:hypothetical protein